MTIHNPTSFDDITGLAPMSQEDRDRARTTIAEYISPDEKIVIGVSGGRDSICLLDLICSVFPQSRYDNALVVHVHHNLRGATADIEQAFVAELAAHYNTSFYTTRLELPEDPSRATYDWCRNQRHAILAEQAETWGGRIALAHSTTDQAETVLMRLATSPGASSLKAMSAEDGNIIRPLFWTDFDRFDCAAYCLGEGLTWHDDPNNAHSKRGQIRDLLFQLNEIDDRTVGNLLETSRRAREDEDAFDRIVRSRLAEGPVHIDELRAMPRAIARRTIRVMAEEATGRSCPKVGAKIDAILAMQPNKRYKPGSKSAIDVDKQGFLHAVDIASEYDGVSFAN